MGAPVKPALSCAHRLVLGAITATGLTERVLRREALSVVAVALLCAGIVANAERGLEPLWSSTEQPFDRFIMVSMYLTSRFHTLFCVYFVIRGLSGRWFTIPPGRQVLAIGSPQYMGRTLLLCSLVGFPLLGVAHVFAVYLRLAETQSPDSIGFAQARYVDFVTLPLSLLARFIAALYFCTTMSFYTHRVCEFRARLATASGDRAAQLAAASELRDVVAEVEHGSLPLRPFVVTTNLAALVYAVLTTSVRSRTVDGPTGVFLLAASLGERLATILLQDLYAASLYREFALLPAAFLSTEPASAEATSSALIVTEMLRLGDLGFKVPGFALNYTNIGRAFYVAVALTVYIVQTRA